MVLISSRFGPMSLSHFHNNLCTILRGNEDVIERFVTRVQARR